MIKIAAVAQPGPDLVGVTAESRICVGRMGVDGHVEKIAAGVEDFLGAAIAFSEDSVVWQTESNVWKKCALFLFGGKIYE